MSGVQRISTAVLLAAVVSVASAANYTWDASGAAPPDDGGGTWNTTGTNWFDGTSYGAWGNTTSDVAVFGVGNGAAGTITVDSVTLNGITFNNAGSGNYTLTGGTLAFGGTSPTITANAIGTSTISSGVTGSAGLTKAGAGALTLSGSGVTYTGTTAVTAGTMIFRDTTNGKVAAADGFTSRISVSDGATIVSERTVTGPDNRAAILGSANSSSPDPWITGTGVLNVDNAPNSPGTTDGGWTIVLGQDAFTMSGTVNINSGVLSRDGGYANVFNTTATFNVASGAVFGATRGGNSIIGALNGGGDVGTLYNVTGGGGTLTVGNGDGSGTFSGSLWGSNTGDDFTLNAGTLSLVKAGTGTQTLSGSSSYIGTTTISAGVLNIRNANALGSTAAGTTVANGAALELQGGIAVGAEALTLSGSGSGGGALRNISDNNSYAGSITLAAASRIASDAGTLTLGSAGTLTGDFDLTFGGAGNVSVARAIATGASSVTKDGAGTLTLSGSNSYSGGSVLSAGTVAVANAAALGTGTVTLAGADLQIFDGLTLANPMELTAGQTSFSTPGNDLQVEYLVVGGGGGGGAYGGGGGGGGVVTGTLSASGLIGIVVGGGGSFGTGTATPATAGFNSSFGDVTAYGGGAGGSQASGGNGSSGGGGGSADFGPTAGGTADNDGSQGFNGGDGSAGRGGGGGGAGGPGADSSAGSNGGIGAISAISGSSTYYGGGGGGGTWTTTPDPGSGGLDGGGNGSQGSTGQDGAANTGGGGGGGGANFDGAQPGGSGGSGIVIVRYQGTQQASGGEVSIGSGDAAGYTIHTFANVGSSSFNLNVGPVIVSGNLSGVGGIRKTGPNRLILSGSNTFTGLTNVDEGSLELGHAQALGSSTFNGGTGTLSFGSLTAATFGGLSGSSSLVLTNSSAAAVALSVGANNQTTTYSGSLSGAGGLVKIGSGALTLSGSSNLGGSTAVNAGQLTVNGVLGTSGVTVADGAILGGSGVIDAAVTVLSGGIVAPGNSPGTLTVNGPYSLADGSILNFELNPTNTTIGGGINDLITGVTNLTLDGILNISGTGDWTVLANDTTWRLVNYSGTLTNNMLSLGTTPTLASGQSFKIDTSTANQVNLVIVPEPGTLALAGLGIAAAAWRARRFVALTRPRGPSA